MPDDSLDLNLDDLTIDEFDDLYEALGEADFDALSQGKFRPRALRAIAWIVKRRDNPEFTLKDAGKLKLRFAADSNPTDAAG